MEEDPEEEDPDNPDMVQAVPRGSAAHRDKPPEGGGVEEAGEEVEEGGGEITAVPPRLILQNSL